MLFLPPEIWMQIFALACIDDGSTGRALSFVSRHFRALSTPFKYQSLSIRRNKQLISWSRLIHTFSPASKVTKYLYIRCPDASSTLDFSDEDDDEDYFGSPMNVESDLASIASSKDSDYEGEFDREEGWDLREEVLDLQRVDEIFESNSMATDRVGPVADDGLESHHSNSSLDRKMRSIDEAVVQALRIIIQELAHSLIILSVHWSSFDSFLVEELFPTLPTLKELYLHRVFTSTDALEPESDIPPSVLFPQLHYLHLSGYLDQRPISFGQYLQAICPNLTSLRAPRGITQHHRRDQADQHYHFPESLQVVILQSYSYIVTFGETVEDLSRSIFGEEKSTRSVRVVTEPYSSSPEQWKSWWIERISGAAGPWTSNFD